VTDKGPTAKGGRCGCQNEYPDIELASGNKVVGSFLGNQVATDSDGNAVSPVKENKKEQPVNMSSHVLLLSQIIRQSTIHPRNQLLRAGITSFALCVKQMI
jgi:hypothetical protein